VLHMKVWLEVLCMQWSTGHYTCSRSFEQVYVKTREGALDNSKESFQVFAWHYELWIVLLRKTRFGQSVGHTWFCGCKLG
jgi:hypothetical protein